MREIAGNQSDTVRYCSQILSLSNFCVCNVLPLGIDEFAAGEAAPPDPAKGSICTLLLWISVRVVFFRFCDIKCQEMSRVKSLDKFLCFRSSCLDDGLSLSLTLAVAFEVLPQDTAEFAAGSAAPPDPGEGSLCTLLSWMQRVSNDFEWQIVLWTVC